MMGPSDKPIGKCLTCGGTVWFLKTVAMSWHHCEGCGRNSIRPPYVELRPKKGGK